MRSTRLRQAKAGKSQHICATPPLSETRLFVAAFASGLYKSNDLVSVVSDATTNTTPKRRNRDGEHQQCLRLLMPNCSVREFPCEEHARHVLRLSSFWTLHPWVLAEDASVFLINSFCRRSSSESNLSPFLQFLSDLLFKRNPLLEGTHSSLATLLLVNLYTLNT